MSIEFDNLDEFFRQLDFSNDKILEGARRGIEEAVNDLGERSKQLAPKKEGKLREGMSITTNVDTINETAYGEVVFSAKKEGSWFNYAAKLHEMGEEYKNPTTPGTQPKFLERPLKQNSQRYKEMIAHAIREEIEG